MIFIDTDSDTLSDESSLGRSSGSEDERFPDENCNNVRWALERELKILARLMKQESSILKQKVTQQRDKVRRECETLLKVDEHRFYALNILWMHYWYAPVKAVVSKPKVSAELQAWLKNFILCGVRHLDKISVKYEDLRPTTLIFIGDLYRYSFVNCGRANSDFRLSQQSYLKAFELNSVNGRPFNQLALLWQEFGSAWKSFGYFLKALIVEEPYARALDNLKRINDQDFAEDNGWSATFNFVRCLIMKFSRANVEKWRKEFEAALNAVIDAKEWEASLEMVYGVSCVTIFFLRNDDFDDQIRAVSVVLCQSWTNILNKFIEHTDNGLLMSVLACAGHFVAELSQSLLAKKVAVSLKFQYQNVVQLYSVLLNANSKRVCDMEINEEKFSSKVDSIWVLNAPIINDVEVVAKFIRSAIDNTSVPLSFDDDKFSTVTSNSALTKSLKTSSEIVVENDAPEMKTDKMKLMEKIGKLHAEFCQKEEEKKHQKSMVPVYLFPDASVLLDKLSVVQNLAKLELSNNRRFIVIVAELVLRQLDKVKRENQRAREAIRWLQSVLTSSVGKGKVRLEMIPAREGDVLNAAFNYIKDQKLLDRKSLFATILTTKKQSDDVAPDGEIPPEEREMLVNYKSVSYEDIDSFFVRIVELEDS